MEEDISGQYVVMVVKAIGYYRHVFFQVDVVGRGEGQKRYLLLYIGEEPECQFARKHGVAFGICGGHSIVNDGGACRDGNLCDSRCSGSGNFFSYFGNDWVDINVTCYIIT